jgi:hypothetical protein
MTRAEFEQTGPQCASRNGVALEGRARPDPGAETYEAERVGQASSLSDERASASMELLAFRCSAKTEVTARPVRSSDRLEACPTFLERPPPGNRWAASNAARDGQGEAVQTFRSLGGNSLPRPDRFPFAFRV